MAHVPRSFCTVIGGPNGSGKSTIYSLLEPVGEFVNADVVARRIDRVSPDKVSIAAGRLVLGRLEEITERHEDFVYETTLSSNQSLALMERCRALGYEVALVFVALDSPDLNVRRIAERVARGGHDIAEHVVRRRHQSAFARLPHAIRLADKALLFDNSSIEPEMLMSIESGRIVANTLLAGSELHRRLAAAAAVALNLDPDTLVRSTR